MAETTTNAGGGARTNGAVKRPAAAKRSTAANKMQEPVGVIGDLRAVLDGTRHPNARVKAHLLYDHCVTIGANVPESIHNLYIIGEHYSRAKPGPITNPEIINGIPSFFSALTDAEKAEYCYRQVIEQLSKEAWPVTVNSLIATRRRDPLDPRSSSAGEFVGRVTQLVGWSLVAIFALFFLSLYRESILPQSVLAPINDTHLNQISWIAFGCVGALVHLLNHALTATRMKTFDRSEERKMGPRLLLGGMFGFIIPWILQEAASADLTTTPALGSIVAFFGGYSVRFATGLLERILAALMPESGPSK